MSPSTTVVHHLTAFKAITGACDLAAVTAAWVAALSLIQGVFGAIGAVLSVVYLVIRIKKLRKQQ